MVYFPYSISVCKSVDQPTIMASSVNLADSSFKSRNKKMTPSSTCSKFPVCHRSRSAVIDIVILIAVVGACGFLLFPYMKLLIVESLEIFGAILYLMGDEVSRAPWIYGSIGLGIFCALLAAWVVLICTSRKCGNPYCKGLRKAAEFDIQLETEECVKNSTPLVKNGVKKGLFELPCDHHRELEAELKKMAPPNGRAVLIFRARCGCSVGRLEVPGPRKQLACFITRGLLHQCLLVSFRHPQDDMALFDSISLIGFHPNHSESRRAGSVLLLLSELASPDESFISNLYAFLST